ncbi:MAG: tRNA uridine(34) 5-carboxymethylaminomethyl modification radical SAM/GNAT enzyme Elp3 [Candidatus Thorarchaeota archaeon]
MLRNDEDYRLHREIIEGILESEVPVDKKIVNQIKNRVCAKYRRAKTPSNADILQASIPEEEEILRPILQKRPVRTVSGVAVVAVMTKPHACPHGKCAYCPGGPDLGVPQSYTGHEPATMRGIQNDFNPFAQVRNRLNQLKTIGHNISKTELIVMGGDWCSKDSEYRNDFVKGCFDAMNDSSSTTLHEALHRNETSQIRNVGLTFETRPDWVTEESIDDMLRMGATRVELGVQTLSDEVLEKVRRGHGVEATSRATKLLRDSGLKVCYHMMPGLPSTTPEEDLQHFRTLFTDSRFQPDMLKIYPTIVVKNTLLYEWWLNGSYTPYNTDQIVDLISRAVNNMPEYVRIQRMQRDIPLHQIEAGLNRGNLRELVHAEMKRRALRDSTIRFREIGHYQMRTGLDPDPAEIQLVRRDYEASDGTETFLSFENPSIDVIFGFLRLRLPSEDAHRPEISGQPCAVIRELRVYGPVVGIGERDLDAWQHLGLGEQLLQAAQELSHTEYSVNRILVNSAIGVKEYYRNLGFKDEGLYLAKTLR